jgi:hypothetical protein
MKVFIRAFWKSKLAVVVGFVLLLVPLYVGANGYFSGSPDTCAKKTVDTIPPEALVYTDQTELELNSVLCIALRAEKYFAAERADVDAAKKAVDDADKAVIELQADATKADADVKAEVDATKQEAAKAKLKAANDKLQDARTKLDAAQKLLAAANTALAGKPPAKTVYLFIDDIRTPSSMDVYITNPKAAKDGWLWHSLKVRAPDDAASDAAKQWRQVLSGTPLEGSRPITLGLGDGPDKEGKQGLLPRKDMVVTGVSLRLYTRPVLICGALGLVLIAAGLIGFGWNTGLLRDAPLVALADRPPLAPAAPPVAAAAPPPAPPPAAAAAAAAAPPPPPPAPPPAAAGGAPAAAPTQLPPFSLARTQFAWWLFLGIGGYLYIWLVTGQFIGVITSGVLTLIGISGVSGLAAQVIDSKPSAVPSKGFLTDILSAGGSVVLHRVQMAAWTLILGVIFLWTAATSFSFPNFDNNLLVLAGIVNGVYLGFKFPEKPQ